MSLRIPCNVRDPCRMITFHWQRRTSAKKIGAATHHQALTMPNCILSFHNLSSLLFISKKYLCVIVGIVWYPGIGVSHVSPWCLLVSPGVIGASSFPPGDQFSKYADAVRYAPDFPGLHRINPIPNVHF